MATQKDFRIKNGLEIRGGNIQTTQGGLNLVHQVSGDSGQIIINNGQFGNSFMRLGQIGGGDANSFIRTDRTLEFHIGQSATSTTPSVSIDTSGNLDITGRYKIEGVSRIVATSSYTEFRNPQGVTKLWLGGGSDGTSDPSAYINGNNFWIRDFNSTVNSVFSSSGLDIKRGDLKLNGTTVIDTSRNLTNIGTISNSAFTIPNSIGSAGQVLKVPSSGTTLEWGNDTGLITSITNFADNRILTASGSTTINAEANLTYDGDRISITDGTFTGYVGDNSSVVGGDADDFVISSSQRLVLGSIGYGRIYIDGSTVNIPSGLHVNGTQVITSTRNLTNIGTISSGAITSTGTSTASGGFITTSDLALRDYTTDARIHLGNSNGGASGVFAGRRLTDNTGLLYGTYWAYDAFWDDGNENWTANRSTLGRKWKAEMGYHLDSFKVSRFDGTVSSPWSQADWDDLLIISSATSTFATDLNLTSGHVYKINNTTVIDSSRNLTNIGTISSGAITTVDVLTVNTDNFDYGIKVAQASGTGYAPASILLEATSSGTRGQGIYHYNTVNDKNWFTGTFYNDASARWGVAYASQTSFNSDIAQVGNALFEINTSGNATFAGTISSGAITSSGNLTLTQSSGLNTLYLDSSGGGNPVIYLEDSNRKWGVFVSSSNLHFKDENGQINALILSAGGNATFSNNVVVTGDLTVNGTTTTLNTQTLDVEDKNITLNYSTGDSSASANGSGLTIQDAVSVGNDATLTWNTANDSFNFSHNLNFADSIKAQFGTGNDLQIYHNGSDSVIDNLTGDLYLTNKADDKDIIFRSDDGSGGFTTYFSLDGANARNRFHRNVLFGDGVRADFGNSSDLKIYHDGSNSYINDSGSGNLRIGGTQVDILNPDSNEFKARFISDGAVELYYDNAKKFETTSGGVSVSGALSIGGTQVISNTRNLTNLGSISSANVLQFLTGGVDKLKIDDIPRGLAINYADSSDWVLDTDGFGSQAGNYGDVFYINGSQSENQVIYSDLPDGTRGLVWHTPSNDASSNADGGWNKDISGLTDVNSYISVVYVRRNGSSTTGTFYHGCHGSHTLNLNGTANTNPYFNTPALSQIPQDVWCVSIGFIRGNADTNTTNTVGGLYRCDTGERIVSYSDFRMKSGSTVQRHRTYLYYDGAGTSSLSWAKPMFYVVDGSEPSMSSLVKPKQDTNANINIGSGTISSGAINATGDITITSTYPVLRFVDTDNNPDMSIIGGSGQIGFYDETNSGYVYQYISGQHNFNAKNLTNIGTISSGAITSTGSSSFEEINFGDNEKAQFGASNDLQIFHDGSNSYISESGTGGLIIKSGGTMQLNSPNDEKMIRMVANDAVELYYDNAKKFETTSGGVSVSGTITSSGNLTVNSQLIKISNTSGQSDLRFEAANDNFSQILFGDTDGTSRGTIRYKHDTDSFFIAAGGITNSDLEITNSAVNVTGGDLQISGTTIVDSSRNLTNIASFNLNGKGSATSIPKTFRIVNTSSNANRYIKFGTISSIAQSGRTVKITVSANAGYNANDTQNTETIIRFKTSNGSSNQSGFYGDCQQYRYGNSTGAPSDVLVKQVSSTEFEFYGKFSNFTGESSIYTVEHESGVWTHSGSDTGATAPSGTVLTATKRSIFTSGTNNNNANLDIGTGTISSGDITSTGTIGNRVSTNIGQQLEKGDTTYATLRFDADNWRVYAGGTGSIGTIAEFNEAGNVKINSGALQMGSTTVIDSSRNLTNIGTINSGAITSSGDIQSDKFKGNTYSSNSFLDFDDDSGVLDDDNTTTLASISEINFIIDTNANGGTDKFYWLKDNTVPNSATQLMDLDKNANLVLRNGTVTGQSGGFFGGDLEVYNSSDLIIGSGGTFKFGTTVIVDASRNLTNIGTISSGAITSSGAIDGTKISVDSGTSLGLRLHTNSGITASNNYMNFFTSQSNGWSFNANGTGADSSSVFTITSTGAITSSSGIDATDYSISTNEVITDARALINISSISVNALSSPSVFSVNSSGNTEVGGTFQVLSDTTLDGDLSVGDDLTVTGGFTDLNKSRSSTTDPILELHNTNSTNYNGRYFQIRDNNGTVRGTIGTKSESNLNMYITGGGAGLKFSSYITYKVIRPVNDAGTDADNQIDLGSSSARFDDIYATNGTIQTSDRNQKQDIQTLTDAEQRVATACKGLIRRFRWQDSVAEKDDSPDSDETARYHFGVIAQDLQDAFTAEGLDAGDYGMFISDTWTDEEGNEQTRLGVRYNELLAFIIATL